MSANATTVSRTRRKKLARGKERSEAGLGHESQNTPSPERAKEDSEFPKGWRIQKLGDVASKIGSGSTPRGGEVVYKTMGVPLIRSMNVHFSGFKPDGLVYLDQVEAEKLEQVTVQKGDVLLNITGASIGRVTTAPDLMAGARVNQHVCIIRPNGELIAAFLAQFLASPDEQARVMNVQVGATRQALTKAMVQNWDVPVPPLAEQRRIVAEIEKQFTRLEAGVAALRRVQANLKRYRSAVLKAACEGRLVPTEADLQKSEGRSQKEFESGEQLLKRILAERRKNWTGRGKYKEPGAPDAVHLPPLPAGWTWATAEQLTDENRSITYGVIKLGAPVADGVHVLRSSDVRHLRLDLVNVKRVAPEIAGEYRRTFLKGGEVLITVRGTLGGVVVAPVECAGFNISREVAMFAMVELAVAKITAIFIGSAPLQRWMLQRAKGIAYTGINIETLKKLPIPLPPLAEQTRIVAEVERRLSVVEELEAVVSANLKQAARLRQSILQKAFTGEL